MPMLVLVVISEAIPINNVGNNDDDGDNNDNHRANSWPRRITVTTDSTDF